MGVTSRKVGRVNKKKPKVLVVVMMVAVVVLVVVVVAIAVALAAAVTVALNMIRLSRCRMTIRGIVWCRYMFEGGTTFGYLNGQCLRSVLF